MLDYMTDAEYAAFMEKDRKQQLLESLHTTAKSSSFSLATLKKPVEVEEEKPQVIEELSITSFTPSKSKGLDKDIEELAKVYNLSEDTVQVRDVIFDDDRWDQMVEDFETLMDPFNDISNKEKYKYKDRATLDPEDMEEYYDRRFSKEYSLLHALLGQVEKDSKAVTAKIKELLASKKPGIGKYSVVDLWNTSNSMHSTKLQTIKEIANIKKLASELKLKEMKNNPPENDNLETSASRHYDAILKGGRANYVNALQGVTTSPQGGMITSSGMSLISDDNSGEIYDTPSNSITRPMNIARDGYDETDDEGYTTSYIDYENDKVQVYIQRFDDGELEFCALDENGRDVPEFPLPDPSLLNNLTIRPDSNYTFDEYGRKYKIIDFGTDFDEVDVVVDDDDDDYL